MSAILGHINHIHEDYSLSFAEVANMYRMIELGKIPLTEKVDGVNMIITKKGNDLAFIRNNEQLKNPLVLNKMAAYYPHTNISSALNDLLPIFKEINNSIDLTDRYINLELIHPLIENVIQYKFPMVILHNVFKVNDNKLNLISLSETNNIFNLLCQINGVQLPTKLSYLSQTSLDLGNEFLKYSLSCSPQIVNIYYKIEQQFKQFIKDRFVGLNNEELIQSLIQRWLYNNKKDNPIDKRFGIYITMIKTFEMVELKNIIKSFKYELEILFGKTANQIIRNCTGYLGCGINNFQERMTDCIRKVKSNKEDSNKLRLEVLKFSELYENTPIQYEGAVFRYNNKQYKLTGTFAPVNQILGFYKYSSR